MKTSVLAGYCHNCEGPAKAGRANGGSQAAAQSRVIGAGQPIGRQGRHARCRTLAAPKFGAVTLFRRVGGAEAARSCLRFFRHVDEPNFRLSGWSCLGEDLPARRTAIGCMLNRLILLTAGNDTKLTELFAHAEIRRSDCATSGAPALSADWVMGADDPHLRGTL